MNQNPINLAFRFFLELAILASLGIWGWSRQDGWLRFIYSIGIPLIAALLWATFRVPNDPGPAPIAVPGIVRLALELSLFSFSIWALNNLQSTRLTWILGVAVALHYLISYDRILWLIKN